MYLSPFGVLAIAFVVVIAILYVGIRVQAHADKKLDEWDKRGM